MKLEYSIGLDIGVSSVGWAVLTDDFRIPKYNDRYAMGVREFESAETAEERRLHRGARRRYNRRIKRIQLLQQTLDALFANDIGFFMQTDENEKHFWRNSNHFDNRTLSETLKNLGKNPRKYPTIYHLRYALLTEKRQFHPRLIYLALHHLVKFRGHFLNENMDWNRKESSDSIYHQLRKYFEVLKEHGYDIDLADEEIEEIIKLLEYDDLTSSDKRTQILKITGREFRQPITLILGLKADIVQLFLESDNRELYREENLKLSFTDGEITEIYEKLTDEEKVIIDLANAIYQNNLLKDLLGDAVCVAEAKVNAYKQFGNDLKTLKQIYNDYFGEEEYRKMFITPRSQLTKYKNTRKVRYLCEFERFLKIHEEEAAFYRNLKGKLQQLLKSASLNKKEKKKIEGIIQRIDRDQFLQKQRNQNNAAIPHQNNVYEAETILKKQQKYYKEISEDMIERVKQIISFRIPYYIGPLVKNKQQSEFGWAIRKKDEPIKPWNIDKVIDHSQSAEAFINRMTSFCAYLLNEKVLPKHSLIYERFELLNELNGIQIRPANKPPHRKYRLVKDEKKWIIENVFEKYKTVTHATLIRELKKGPYKYLVLDQDTGEIKDIFGTQGEDSFHSSLSTYIDMTQIFGEVTDDNQDMIEEIIYWITVFEEKEILKMRIRKKYKNLDNKQIQRLVHLMYSGWGRLSRKLIDEMPINSQQNDTILSLMEREPLVFMEVISNDEFNLNERIAKMNQTDDKQFTKIKYRDIQELQGSPALKKAIWQAILIIEELVEIFGEPKNIMIEFARHDEETGRTRSRKQRINQLYRTTKQDEADLKAFLKEHIEYETAEYRNNRLYLYIVQEGKCLYTGKRLNISRLHEYEVDHIYPRSFVKDDSIDNLALVTKEINQKKGNRRMPLEVMDESQRVIQKKYWKRLFDHNLISQTKYYRLMKEEFTDQDKESFFARQLVETRQITKHVRNLLLERFEHTAIHPVNANIVTHLRNHTETYKIRDLNNKHHAVDAALTALIVLFIIKKHGYNFLNFDFRFQKAREKWRDMLTTYGKHFFLFSEIDQYDHFKDYRTGKKISGREYLKNLNYHIPWQTTKQLGSSEGAFYEQTIYSPKSTLGRNPRYESSKLHKGVHSGLKEECSYLISYKYKTKSGMERVDSRVVKFYVIEKYQKSHYSEEQLARYLASKVTKHKVIDATIHTKIQKHQPILIEGQPFNFVTLGEMHNAKQFIIDEVLTRKLYQILNERREFTVKEIQEVYESISEQAINEYTHYLLESGINNIKKYKDEIKDLETFIKGITELFNMTDAGPGRSSRFGGRIKWKINPRNCKFIYQSITGLKYRKPKSYTKELWKK